MKRVNRTIFFTLFLVAVLSGCGYQFSGGGSILPNDVRKIYIPIVENDTTEGSLGPLLTEALRDQFERFGVIEVVNGVAEADAILETKITKLTRSARSTTSRTDYALQSDAILTVSTSLKRLSGQLLWSNPELQVSRSYGESTGGIVGSSSDFAGGVTGLTDLANLDPRQAARGQEQAALEDMASKVARKIYTDSVAPDF